MCILFGRVMFNHLTPWVKSLGLVLDKKVLFTSLVASVLITVSFYSVCQKSDTLWYLSFLPLLGGLNAVLMWRQSCVEAYAEDAQAPASSFGSEKEGSLSKA